MTRRICGGEDRRGGQKGRTEGGHPHLRPIPLGEFKLAAQHRYDGGTNFQELGWAYNITKELIRAGGMGGGIGSILYTDETMAPGTPGPWTSFVYDAVGNTTVTADSAGIARQETVYDAFGNAIYQSGDSDNNRLRNTKERDASTGLDDDGFRYYDPSTGAYLQRDPSGYSDGLNVYLSDHDDPVNKVDPLGLASEESKGPKIITVDWNRGRMWTTQGSGRPVESSMMQAGPTSSNSVMQQTVAYANAIKDASRQLLHNSINTVEAIGDPILHPVRNAVIGGAFFGLGKLPGMISEASEESPALRRMWRLVESKLQAGEEAVADARGEIPKGAGISVEGTDEPAQLSRGKRAHREEPVLPGEAREVTTPSGKRMDRYNQETAHIREIKPNNPRAMKAGEKQVEDYKKEKEAETGRPHTTEVTPYDPSKYDKE